MALNLERIMSGSNYNVSFEEYKAIKREIARLENNEKMSTSDEERLKKLKAFIGTGETTSSTNSLCIFQSNKKTYSVSEEIKKEIKSKYPSGEQIKINNIIPQDVQKIFSKYGNKINDAYINNKMTPEEKEIIKNFIAC